MAFFQFRNIEIAAIASAVPREIVHNDSYKNRFGDEAVEKFKSMVGVEEVRRTKEHQTASDLGFAAATRIIAERNIEKKDIGALVFISHSMDYRAPATACVLHKRLGLGKNCAAFDVGLGCSAFVYGVQIVCSMLSNSDIQKGLLIVGESLTKRVNPEDKSAVMLFGDGGSAILFEKTQKESSISVSLCTDGAGYKTIITPGGGFRNMNPSDKPIVWKDGNIRTLYNTNMNGKDVFAFSISDVSKTIKEFLDKTETTVVDYDCFAMHQANLYIHKQLQKQLKIPAEKMPVCMKRYGNTSASAIPLVLCDTYGTVHDEREISVLMCGFGVGLSWGVVSANIKVEDIYEVITTDEIFEEGIINGPQDM